MYTPPQRHLIGKFAVSPISLAIALTFSLSGTDLSYAQTVPENFLEPKQQVQINQNNAETVLSQFDTMDKHFSYVDLAPTFATRITSPISTNTTYNSDVAFLADTPTGLGIGSTKNTGGTALILDAGTHNFTISGLYDVRGNLNNAFVMARSDRVKDLTIKGNNLAFGTITNAVFVARQSASLTIESINDIYVEQSDKGTESSINSDGGTIRLTAQNGSLAINTKSPTSSIESYNNGLVSLNASDKLFININPDNYEPGIDANSGGKIEISAGNLVSISLSDTSKDLIWADNSGEVSIKSKVVDLSNGWLYATNGRIDINSDELTYINSNIDNRGGYININQNSSNSSKVVLLGDIKTSIYYGEKGISKINFGKNGLFIGKTHLSNTEIDLIFKDNSVWYVEGDSIVTSLDMNNALVDFTAEKDKDTSITTDSLDAQNAVFLMDVIATSNKVSNDSLKVQKSASGNAFVHVPSSGQGDGKTDSGVLIETPTGQNISYALASPALSSDGTNTPVIDLGVYNYELKTEDRNGKTVTYLTPYVPKSDPTPDPDPTPTPNPEPNPGEPELSPSANAVLALAGSGMQTTQFLYSLSDLRKRMGEIRYGAEDGLYAGIRGGRDEISSFASTSFRNEYGAWSIGYDHRVNDEWIVGALFEAIEGDQRVKSHGYRADGEDSTQGFRAYATWFNNEGAYADFVVGLNRFDQDISTNMLDGRKVEGDFDGIGWGVSAEVGRQFLMGDDKTWFIEPQAQFAYFRVKGEDFSLDNGMTVDQDSTDSLTGRFGLIFGKTKVDNDGKGYQLTGKFGINHEFMGESDIKVNGVKFSYDSLETRGYYGVGFNWYLSKHARVYGQVEREQGSRFTSEINARLGVKYHF